MTAAEITKFREDFASIVYLRGQIKSYAASIRRLESWNKGGSHDNAIARDYGILDGYKAKIKEKLRGKPYDAWRDFSKTLTTTMAKMKASRNDATKNKWQAKIDSLTWA
jgi:hypothetical protein